MQHFETFLNPTFCNLKKKKNCLAHKITRPGLKFWLSTYGRFFFFQAQNYFVFVFSTFHNLQKFDYPLSFFLINTNSCMSSSSISGDRLVRSQIQPDFNLHRWQCTHQWFSYTFRPWGVPHGFSLRFELPGFCTWYVSCYDKRYCSGK